MSDFIETPEVQTLSLATRTDESGATQVCLTILMQSGRTARIPMSEELAAQLFLLLDRLRKDREWVLGEAKIDADRIQ